MKVLTATSETQGRRKNDFCHATEGDLVTFGFECDREKIDGKCGCRRAMMSLGGGATTTMKVVDDPEMTKEKYLDRLIGSLEAGGWLAGDDGEVDLQKGREWASEQLEDILAVCDYAKAGDIVEKRGNAFIKRSPKPGEKPRDPHDYFVGVEMLKGDK